MYKKKSKVKNTILCLHANETWIITHYINQHKSNTAVRQKACVTVTMGGGIEFSAAEEALLKTGAASWEIMLLFFDLTRTPYTQSISHEDLSTLSDTNEDIQQHYYL